MPRTASPPSTAKPSTAKSRASTRGQTALSVIDKGKLIATAMELYKSYNPNIDSIDTHLEKQIGNWSGPTFDKLDASKQAEVLFLQQCVYGLIKEKKFINAFTSNFFADNAANISRADTLLYSLMAYLAIFRLSELKFSRFKEFLMTQDPTKMYYFINYLFTPRNLKAVLLDSWMKIKDLTFCEQEIIAPLLKYNKEAMALCAVLNASAAEAQRAADAAEKAQAEGTAGLGTVTKRKTTIPISPRITAVRPPRFPEVFQISQKVEANEVPKYLNNWSLEKIEAENDKRKQKSYEDTYNKYKNTKIFTFNESNKAYKTLEETRREVEEERVADVDFNASFVKPVPDFARNSAKVRLNASTILREDNLLRKQQAKDADLLKTYEMELRDPTEYYLWQTNMRENDKHVQLERVIMRREQAKQSSENTRFAMAKELEGKQIVAKLMRKQGEQVKKQKQLAQELEILEKQEIVEKVQKVRDTAPSIAVKKIYDKKVEDGKIAKAELQKAITEKEEEDKLIQAAKDDKIRQLQAVNNVHRRFIKVFDPTSVAGPLFLDQMSYMEMKERQSIARSKEEAALVIKNQDINERKAKKAKEMQTRMEGVMRSREAKAVSNRTSKVKKVEEEEKGTIEKEKKIETAAITLEKELRIRRQAKKDELAALKEEEEMIKRKQQYLGAAASAVDEKKAEELLKAQERKIQVAQVKQAEAQVKQEVYLEKNKKNAKIVKRHEKVQAANIAREKEEEALIAKRERLAKSKAEILNKKDMAAEGREQHDKTAIVKFKHNPYASNENYGRKGFKLEPKTSKGETLIMNRMMSGTIET